MATDLAIERPVVPSSQPAPASLAEQATADGVRFILATFVDLNGKPCSKLVPVEAADQLQADGVGFAGYAAGATGQVPADPDLIAVPDLASYAALPFVRPGLAMVQCDPHVEGEPWPFAPRVMLRRMIERAARQSVELWTGAEIEYFLVARDADGAARLPRTLLEAVTALEADPVLREGLNCADDEDRVAGYFAHLKSEEFYAYHSQVTTWELDRYLSA